MAPLLVGISNQHTVDYYTCLEVLRICKELRSDILTVIGGVHVSFFDELCAKSPDVDVVVRGEGEWTLLDLLQNMARGGDFKNVKGITYKQKTPFSKNRTACQSALKIDPFSASKIAPPQVKKNIHFLFFNLQLSLPVSTMSQ